MKDILELSDKSFITAYLYGLDDLKEKINILRKDIADIEMELPELKIHFLKFKIHWKDLTENITIETILNEA